MNALTSPAALTAATLAAPNVWEIRAPLGYDSTPATLTEDGQWLREVWALRGSVFFDNGRRPAFANGLDVDKVDGHSYHVLLRRGGQLVGCIRVLPRCSSTGVSPLEELLGRQGFDSVFRQLDVSRWNSAEVGRWCVLPGLRGGRVGMRLMAGAWALAQALGCTYFATMAGMCDNQDQIIERFGFRSVPGVATMRCEEFEDSVRLMYAPLEEPEPRFATLMEETAIQLRLKAPKGLAPVTPISFGRPVEVAARPEIRSETRTETRLEAVA